MESDFFSLRNYKQAIASKLYVNTPLQGRIGGLINIALT